MSGMALGVLGVISLWLAWQDFQQRAVSVWLLCGFFVVSVYYWRERVEVEYIDLLFNLAYLVVLLTLSFAVLGLVKRMNPRSLIGLGDVLFITALALLFSFPAFVLWFNLILILTFFCHWIIYQLFAEYRSNEQIPLVGLSSPLFYIAFIIENHVFSISQYFFRFG